MRFTISCIIAYLIFCIPACAQTGPFENAEGRANAFFERTQPGYYPKTVFDEYLSTIDYCSIKTCKPAALPVTLVRFYGERLDASDVMLFWETSEEVNNEYFEVERTLNPSWGFETVATVKGAGSTRAQVKYQTKDLNESEVYTYYRLKQVDFDGTYAYSSIIAIKGGAGPLTVAAFPNPGRSGNITFKTTGLNGSEHLNFAVYDVAGKLVFQKQAAVKISEQQELQVPLPNLPPGKYSFKLQADKRDAVSVFVLAP